MLRERRYPIGISWLVIHQVIDISFADIIVWGTIEFDLGSKHTCNELLQCCPMLWSIMHA